MSAAHGRRYPISVVTEARQLAAGDWTPAEIAKVLNRRGIPVARDTVARWVKPDVHLRRNRTSLANARRARAAARLASADPWLRADATPEYKTARLLALDRLGVLDRAQIAAVLTIDFGAPINAAMVSAAIDSGCVPAPWRRADLRSVPDDAPARFAAEAVGVDERTVRRWRAEERRAS